MSEEPSQDVPADTDIDTIVEVLPINPTKRYKVTSTQETFVPNQDILVEARQQTLDLFFTIDSVAQSNQLLMSTGNIDSETILRIERELNGIHDMTKHILIALRTWDISPDEAREALIDSGEVIGIFQRKYNWPSNEEAEEYLFNFDKETEKIGPLRDVIHSLNGTSFGISNYAGAYQKAKEEQRQIYVDSIKTNLTTLRWQNIAAIETSERGYPPELIAEGGIYAHIEKDLRIYSRREAALKMIGEVQLENATTDSSNVTSNSAFARAVGENAGRNAAEFFSQLPQAIKSSTPLLLTIYSEDNGEFTNIIIADNGIGLKLEPGQERVDFVMGKSSSGGNGVVMASLAKSARKLGGDLYMRPRKDGERGTEVVLRVKKAPATSSE